MAPAKVIFISFVLRLNNKAYCREVSQEVYTMPLFSQAGTASTVSGHFLDIIPGQPSDLLFFYAAGNVDDLEK